MAHLTGFGVENFRVFKEKTWFDFAPITVLTGPNSSGKSSLIKSLNLIKNTILTSKSNQVKDTFKLNNLNFVDDNLKLGSFKSILNTDTSQKSIEFILPFQLLDLNDHYNIALTYKIDQKNILENGKLVKMLIYEKNTEKQIICIKETSNRNEENQQNQVYVDIKYLVQILNNRSNRSTLLEYNEEEIKQRISSMSKENVLSFRLIPNKKMLIENIENIISEKKKLSKLEELFLTLHIIEVFKITPSEFKDFLKSIAKNKIHIIEEENFGSFQKIMEGYKSEHPIFHDIDSIINSEFQLKLREIIKTSKKDEINVNLKEYELEYLTKYNNDEYQYNPHHSLLDDFHFHIDMILFDIYGGNEIDENGIGHFIEYKGNALAFFNHFLQDNINNGLGQLTNKFHYLTSIDSIRATIQRLYTNQNQGSKFNALLLEFEEIGFRNDDIEILFINNYIKYFRIGKEIIIERDKDGIGSKVYVMTQLSESLKN